MLFVVPILSIIHCFFITNAHPYNIVFLKGSRVKNEFYSPFLQQLQTQLETQTQNLPQKPTVKIGEYFPTAPPRDPSILIGHSFGGYFGLLQAIQYSKNIRACILLNSHFNQRIKMPYTPLPLDTVRQPTLLLLNQQDETLPLSKAMDDYHVYRHPKLPHPPTTPRKEFRIRPGTHFSSFTEPAEIQQTVQEIIQFIDTLHETSTAITFPVSEFEKQQHPLDKICEWQLPDTRNYYHLSTFIKSKPGFFHCLYHPGNLYKTRNLPEEVLKQALTREIHTLLASSHPYYSIAPSSLPEIRFKKTYLPLGPKNSHIQTLRNGLFLYSLTKWLSQDPQIYYSTTPYPLLVVELLVIPIIEDMVYYKLPNKLRFLELNSPDTTHTS